MLISFQIVLFNVLRGIYGAVWICNHTIVIFIDCKMSLSFHVSNHIKSNLMKVNMKKCWTCAFQRIEVTGFVMPLHISHICKKKKKSFLVPTNLLHIFFLQIPNEPSMKKPTGFIYFLNNWLFSSIFSQSWCLMW